MRVAHLATVDLSLRYLVFPQLTAVRDLGGEAVGISAPGPYVADLTAAGIRHVPLPGSTRSFAPLGDLRAALALWRILRRERPDVLHTHTPKPGIYGRIVGRLAGVPAILNTIHGLYATPDDRLAARIAVYTLEAIASRFSDAELVQSREDLELVTRRRITRPERTVLLGNGVDLARFDPDRFPATHRERVRAELEIPEDRIVVGMVGRLVAEKGYPELFAAARLLGPGYVVLAIGPHEPEKADALAPEVVAAARRDGVRLLGMRTDVDRLYGAMDLFVLPSHREGFPRAAMEAAAMGLPIVATDIRGCREVVEHAVNGLLVPVADPAALAGAIRSLGEDSERRRRMGAAGRDKARREFDEREVVRRVLSEQVRALRAKGCFERFATAPDVRLREATVRDVPIVARLHADGIATGFLPRLGPGFLEELYRALVAAPGTLVLVAEDEFAPIGFVAGAADTAAFFSWFARRRGVRAARRAASRLLRPGNLRRAWETWRYDGEHLGVPAELLSMAVAPPFRGAGIGRRLGATFLERLAAEGTTKVKVVVAAANAPAQATYRGLGFRPAGTFEVHAGEPSLLMVRAQT